MNTAIDSPNVEAQGAEAAAPAPTFTIVIATRQAAGLAVLLETVAPKCRARGAELIVAAPVSDELAALRKRFPEAVFFDAPADADLDQLRQLGTAESNGDILILSDDTRPLPEEWLTTQ
jgi:hypothetical protein